MSLSPPAYTNPCTRTAHLHTPKTRKTPTVVQEENPSNSGGVSLVFVLAKVPTSSSPSSSSAMNWFHLGLAGLMLVTGSINTLSVKWADTMTSESTDGKVRGFDHPFLQACGMFLGETMCMAAFFLLRWRRRRALRAAGADPAQDPFTRPRTFSPLVFLPPALCDMTATSIQYIGLTLTYASSFQMLRGEK